MPLAALVASLILLTSVLPIVPACGFDGLRFADEDDVAGLELHLDAAEEIAALQLVEKVDHLVHRACTHLVDAADGVSMLAQMVESRTRETINLLPELVQLMIEMAVSTGMRISEILGLKWGCVDLVRGLVWVRERYYWGDTDEPKSERSRRVLPLGYLVEAYRRRRARCPTLSGYVFEKDGEPMDDRALLKDEIRPAAKQLGIYFPGFGWRSFTWSGEKRQCSGCRNDYWEKEQARR